MLVDFKIIKKLAQIEKRYEEMRFVKICDVAVKMFETYEHFTREPAVEASQWKPAAGGTKWGDNWRTAWFAGDVTLPEACGGKRVFIRARTGGESLFIADGQFMGVFDENHPAVLMTMKGVQGKTYHLAIESYAGHHIPGSQPDASNPPPGPGCKTFDGIELVLERGDVSAFVFDLRVLRQLAACLDNNGLRQNKLMRELSRVFEAVDAMPGEEDEEIWRPKLAIAGEIMKPLLEARNGSTVPRFGIVGHSHIDTAWLWPIDETWRKCARTFSSVLNLMERYPEFTFIQSAPYHTYIIRERYPEIYERIREKVNEGRWEPNGAMWVEADCNIPSGESFVRQLLIGQKTTMDMFGYSADTLWLPDVFGYSAALPQILRGCGVEFFCTSKLAWNDTNKFPYDTFVWKGIDGSSVITHFINMHCWPDPETLVNRWNGVLHKDVQDRCLSAIGYGDGGGGPMAEMIEISRRVKDTEGCPRTDYVKVGDFMKSIRDELKDLPEWCGELYLELHRGTLTSIAELKRGNRKAELALRNAEFVCTLASLSGRPYPAGKLEDIWKKLLTNQFHDILPGSSIARVNDEAVKSFSECIEEASALADEALAVFCEPADNGEYRILAVNSLSWDRKGEFILANVPENHYLFGSGITSQWIPDLEGEMLLAVSGIEIPALGSRLIQLSDKQPPLPSPFRVNGNTVETPHAVVIFDDIGRIISFTDRITGREVVKPGGALNTFWLGEDIPLAWDNWDIDREQRLKMETGTVLTSRETAADGPVQLRLRCRYKLGLKSFITQDIVFHANAPQVDFETVVDWAEKHKLLKAGFELDILADYARHEIQYGYVERPAHENLPQDRARFEVCNHKWTDISEAGFGVALLNDCKYGVSTVGGDIRLSLLKSGLRPDMRGNEGRHVFTYSLLPHHSAFSVESVVRPAYELNVPVISASAAVNAEESGSLVSIDTSNIIAECIKWAEKGNGFIIRLYDAEKNGRIVRLTFGINVKSIYKTNLLEEKAEEFELKGNSVDLYIKPFEIVTLLCEL